MVHSQSLLKKIPKDFTQSKSKSLHILSKHRQYLVISSTSTVNILVIFRSSMEHPKIVDDIKKYVVGNLLTL